MNKTKNYHSLSEFYLFCLSEHSNRTSCRLHFIGTTLALLLFIAALGAQIGWLIAIALVQVYALAWIGHFFFEHNKPATFNYPWLGSLGGGVCVQKF
ncbi:MAG: DUF962 domain-containing protein [Methylococcales bacterium]|nr:DUF962 domain-containing protein [Methylococcales bacterium]